MVVRYQRGDSHLLRRGEIRSKEVKELAEEMVAQMQARRGCGLSAPQVGVSKQLVVFEVSEECIRNEGMARDLTVRPTEALRLSQARMVSGIVLWLP